MKRMNRFFSAAYILLVLLLLFAPIIVMMAYSFNRSDSGVIWTGFSLKWYKELLSHPDALRAFGNSLQISVTSTVFSIFIGALAAIGFYKYNFKFKNILDSFFYIPTIVPAMLLGISLLSFYEIVGIPLSKLTIIIAHITFCAPITFNTIRVALNGFDKSIEEAGRDLGCNELQIITRVIIPAIIPAMFSGGLLAFTFSFDDVLTSFFVAGPGDETLSMYIFGMIKTGVKPSLNALSTLLILAAVTLGILSQLAENKRIRE